MRSQLFEIEHCYDMYFQIFNSTIQFKVLEYLDKGYLRAKVCSTEQEFVFDMCTLSKQDLKKLKKVKCNGCIK